MARRGRLVGMLALDRESAAVLAIAAWRCVDAAHERLCALDGRGWLVLAAHVHVMVARVVLATTATDQDVWRL